MATKHRLRFSVNDDLLLLREVVSNNPFQDDTKWQVIINNMNEMTKRKFKHRTVKEHVQHLLKLFQQEDRKNLRKSSSEEQYAEKESLLQQVFNLMNKHVEKKICAIDGSNKTLNVKEEQNYAETNLEDPLVIYINTEADTEAATHLQTEILTPDSEESTAQYAMSKRAKKQDLQNSAFEYLKIRSEEHILLEKQKLELEQKKYELDQERFKLEVEERKRRLEMEIKEREEAIKDKQHNRRLLDELLNIIVSEKLKKN